MTESRSRDTRQRFEQWVNNTQCEANTISAVKGRKMSRIAKKEGISDTREQSIFAVTRGNVFEHFLLNENAKVLIEELAKKGLFKSTEVSFFDFRTRQHGGTIRNHDESLEQVKKFFENLKESSSDQNLIVGATIRIPGGGMLPEAILVIDSLAILKDEKNNFRAIVGEIKSFPDKEGYTNGSNLSTARAQAGIYVHGLRVFLKNECDLKIGLTVSNKGFLVFSLPGSNFPSARIDEDFKFQSERAKRGFQKLQAVAEEIKLLDDEDTDKRIISSDIKYSPKCFQFCDRAPKCLEKAYLEFNPMVLGEDVSKFVGGLKLSRIDELLKGDVPKTDAEKDFIERFNSIESSRRIA